jgi:hypothetical protein
VKVRTPALPADVLIPAMPPMPEVPAVAPLNIRVPKLDLKLHLKIAQLESRVSQLQLESKKLEIAAFGAEGEEKEKLIDASREKLLEAEAEKLQVQIEQQKEQIKALEEALKEQAKEMGKHAAKTAMDADVVAEKAAQIELRAEKEVQAAVAQAAVDAKQAADAVKWKVQDRALFVDRNTDRQFAIAGSGATISAGPDGGWIVPDNDQEGALSLQPGDHIRIEVVGAFPDKPIDGDFTVEPMGTVALGATYGRAKVVGLSVLDAEKAIIDHLKRILSDAQVQVTYVGRPQPRIIYSPAKVDPAPSSTAQPALGNDGEPSDDK